MCTKCKPEHKFKKLPLITPLLSLGCDPELFLTRDNEIIGSEKALPENGIDIPYSGKIVRDGVQVELNPKPNTCRANLGNTLKRCFIKLAEELVKTGTKTDFSRLVKVTETELKSLSPKSQTFGCMPSYNVYHGESIIDVDARTYLFRSAGGHIHFGGRNDQKLMDILKDVDKIVPLFDIIIGNTCVLVDRDEGNIERRKNYGRAGEFRTPEYGVEYRTISNFWLRSYQTFGLVMGLARLAVTLAYHSDSENNYAEHLKSLVDIKDIEKAINENDFDLAYSNFKKIEGFLMEIIPAQSSYSAYYPLEEKNISAFHFFVEKGLDHWFKDDPLQHWISIPEGHGTGWETFLENTVMPQIKK